MKNLYESILSSTGTGIARYGVSHCFNGVPCEEIYDDGKYKWYLSTNYDAEKCDFDNVDKELYFNRLSDFINICKDNLIPNGWEVPVGKDFKNEEVCDGAYKKFPMFDRTFCIVGKGYGCIIPNHADYFKFNNAQMSALQDRILHQIRFIKKIKK